MASAQDRAERYAALLWEVVLQSEETGRITPALTAHIRTTLTPPEPTVLSGTTGGQS